MDKIIFLADEYGTPLPKPWLRALQTFVKSNKHATIALEWPNNPINVAFLSKFKKKTNLDIERFLKKRVSFTGKSVEFYAWLRDNIIKSNRIICIDKPRKINPDQYEYLNRSFSRLNTSFRERGLKTSALKIMQEELCIGYAGKILEQEVTPYVASEFITLEALNAVYYYINRTEKESYMLAMLEHEIAENINGTLLVFCDGFHVGRLMSALAGKDVTLLALNKEFVHMNNLFRYELTSLYKIIEEVYSTNTWALVHAMKRTDLEALGEAGQRLYTSMSGKSDLLTAKVFRLAFINTALALWVGSISADAFIEKEAANKIIAIINGEVNSGISEVEFAKVIEAINNVKLYATGLEASTCSKILDRYINYVNRFLA